VAGACPAGFYLLNSDHSIPWPIWPWMFWSIVPLRGMQRAGRSAPNGERRNEVRNAGGCSGIVPTMLLIRLFPSAVSCQLPDGRPTGQNRADRHFPAGTRRRNSSKKLKRNTTSCSCLGGCADSTGVSTNMRLPSGARSPSRILSSLSVHTPRFIGHESVALYRVTNAHELTA
jgi:hypothetical protein